MFTRSSSGAQARGAIFYTAQPHSTALLHSPVAIAPQSDTQPSRYSTAINVFLVLFTKIETSPRNDLRCDVATATIPPQEKERERSDDRSVAAALLPRIILIDIS